MLSSRTSRGLFHRPPLPTDNGIAVRGARSYIDFTSGDPDAAHDAVGREREFGG